MAYTADWNPLGDVFYRKQENYSMLWSEQVDLDNFIIAASLFGGPIALIRNEKKVQKVAGLASKPIIFLFTSSGKQIAQIRWTSGQVIQMGWSNAETLLCVQDCGAVLEYDIFGNFKRTFSMGQEAKDVKIKECEIFRSYIGTGIAVLTNTNRIFVTNNIYDDSIRLWKLSEIPGVDNSPTAWTMLSKDRNSCALAAVGRDLYMLQPGGQYQEQRPPISSDFTEYTAMAVSFNNKYLALFTDTGLLWIGSSDLQKRYCEFDTASGVKPEQLTWCGTGAILGYWKNVLLMVGPQKDWVKFAYETPIHLVPEMDGVRIISRNSNEFLQKVPGVSEEIFKIGSMAPGAMLYEAAKEFQKGSQKADEYIRMIKDKLDEAVEQCIEAAGQEWEPHTQKALLRAASFGKCFLTDYQAESFVDMCQMLRVLNAVRDSNLGIPLTYSQLKHLSLPVLIDRLVARRQFGLAIEICKYLKLREQEGASRILAHWARFKVQQTTIEDEVVARAIVGRLGDTPGVSYSEIAHNAIECGRKALAVKLLDFEPRAVEQVPLLMKMGKIKEALNKAIESGDTDLMFTVVLYMKESQKLGDFLMQLRGYPTAHSLYLQYCKSENRKMLQDIHEQEDQHAELAGCRVWESYQEERLDARLSALKAAMDSYTKRNEWSAKQTEEQMKLLKLQKKLESDYNRPYLDLSVHDTVFKLIQENNHKWAEQIRKDFKIPDKRFWWLKIEALAEAGDWAELDRFSKSKKSPIGYEPFVDMCVKYSRVAEVNKYIQRVQPEHKVKCYVKMGMFNEAVDAALQSKDLDGLNLVLQKCGGEKEIVEKVRRCRTQLGAP